ncbi:gamma-mobile-trio recombinase GmtY [Photobacterium kishitanii]|uniref:gamma-mobile-trio recombinase GmtY n=1 Tax=Photobacterium kishitanii TaxID=318456 RepID=UPI000D15B8CD|nr:gamma-mobile-trio recombinase GmtY [Photobacterium kishitanii]PSV16137.1 integrase [Photobacterium kishitanii]
MVTLVKAQASIRTDNTGALLHVPVLLTEHGVFNPLLDYILSQSVHKSLPWMNRVVFACQLLLEYMEANRDLFSCPDILFQHFVQRLSDGTIDAQGYDPSGLFWLPRKASNVNQLLSALNGLTDWLEINNRGISLNPFIEASTHQERLNYAAWHKKNQYHFLGHIKPKGISDTMRKTRKVRGKKDVIKVDGDAISFPENLFKSFFIEGVGTARDPRIAMRDQLILLLMHGAGVRISDAMHLWVDDVFHDPQKPNNVIVRLYHPEDGKAPNNWIGYKKYRTRAAYLAEEFRLKPRNKLTGTARVGWKTRLVDHDDNYIQLHWFPSYLGEVFAYLWQQYLLYLLPLERTHPYAFVSFSKESLGSPLTINAYNQSYKAAMARINQIVSKPEGRSPHGHRHAYGRRLSNAKIDPLLIKKAMHHSSLISQTIYTQPGIRDVSHALETATEQLDKKLHNVFREDVEISWKTILEHGFSNIDPDGLFSGRYPKFKRSS